MTKHEQAASDLDDLLPDNYVFVDIDKPAESVTVYSNCGELCRLYTSCSPDTIKRACAFASKEAKRLGCDWGTNE